jgi:micrococcal nuclease
MKIYHTLFCILIFLQLSGCLQHAVGNGSEKKPEPQTQVKHSEPAQVKPDGAQAVPKDTKNLYQVIRVVDGDTIQVEFEGQPEKVRYIGVDTPETVHPSKPVQYCGKEASAFNKELVEGKQVGLVFDVEKRDKYGRLLAYVYIDDLFINAELIKRGLAVVSTYPPNVAHVDEYTALQTQARENGLGVWADGTCEDVGQGSTAVEKDEPVTVADSNCAYVGSKKSDKYHDPECKWAKKIKPSNLVCFKSRDEAVKAGYVPCGVCDP